MNARHVCIAEPVVGEERIAPIALCVDLVQEPQRESFSVEERRRFFDDQAQRVMDVIDRLPGGTRDALLVRLLDHARSIRVVR